MGSGFTFHCMFLYSEFFTFIFILKREQEGRKEVEGERDDRKLTPHSAWRLTQGSIPGAWIMTWDKIKSKTFNWLSHPGAPTLSFFKSGTIISFIKKNLKNYKPKIAINCMEKKNPQCFIVETQTVKSESTRCWQGLGEIHILTLFSWHTHFEKQLSNIW